MNLYKQIILIIIDGWGYREAETHNAIAEADTPCFDSLWQTYPHALLEASGEAVGLPAGEMGNSEVGHMSIGAGRALDNDVVRISKTIAANALQDVDAIKAIFTHVKQYNSTLHLLGLVSPGGVHSHQEHLFALLRTAKVAGIHSVVIHAFTDGRDTPPQSGAQYLRDLENVIDELQLGTIATIGGRYYGMDRDTNWDRIEKAEKALFKGEGTHYFGKKPSKVLTELYSEGAWDEHLEPIVFSESAENSLHIQQNDGVIFFNFRADRARQLSHRIAEYAKSMNLCFVTMTEYDPTIESLVAFPTVQLETVLAKELAQAGLTQIHIAETEKYAHVTYFLNGGVEVPFHGEERMLIESRKDIKTHNEAPDMRADEIGDAVVAQISKAFNFIALNFANPDMVGHSADHAATIKAVEAVDRNIAKIVTAAKQHNALVLITADHGNAEITHDADLVVPHTAHTTNPVPFIMTDQEYVLHNGALTDVAPTILHLFGITKPASMTGVNLLEHQPNQ